MANINIAFEKKVIGHLIKFQRDPNCKRIRNLFNHKTYFDILKKKYDENTHSAFIAWLLEGRDLNIHKDDLPIMSFLDLLIDKTKNDKKKKTKRFDEKLKQAVLTRTADIVIKDASTEKVIKDLSSIEESKDRIDIYVECQVMMNDNEYLLQIFIENKIGSTEGRPKKEIQTPKDDYENYCTQKQTKRYFFACSDHFSPDGEKCEFAARFIKNGKKASNVLQLFVYLTPSDATGPSDKDNYIHINYQELYSRVVSPLLNETTIDPTCFSLIKEYALTLTLPPADKSDRRRILAIGLGGEEEKLLSSFWIAHKDLVKLAADHYAEKESTKGLKKASTKASGVGRKDGKTKANEMLEKFWSVNSDVIMAACYLHMCDEKISPTEFEEINYYLSNLTPGWDRYMYRYKINKKFKVSKSLLKRNLVLEIVKILLNDKNVKLAKFHPLKLDDDRQKPFSFIVEQDVLINDFRDNPSALEARYFSDIFDIDGVKYRLSNQWGAGIIFNAFIDKMAEFGFEIKQVAVNGVVKWDDND